MRSSRSHDFTLRHRIASAVSRRLQGVVYTSKGGITKGLRRKGGLGFFPGAVHQETAEVRFLQALNFAGKVVFDLGGYQGLLTIFFAKAARQVITFEANPANVVRIYENAGLNSFTNVFVRNVAVGNHDGILKLRFDPSMSGAASGDPEIFDQIGSSAHDVREFSVVLTTIDADIRRFHLPEPDFVKIDIEGMELDALEGMVALLASRKPDLYLELHGTTPGDKLANATNVIEFIRQRGYGIFDVEQNRDVTQDVPTGRESHIYCQAVV
jgi:FkbM family methyltransferase